MRLKELSKKPALVEVQLDDEDTVKEYGESLQFMTWDRVPLDVFTKLASVNQTNLGDVVDIVRLLILDEEGREVMSADQVLPPHVLIKAIAKIVERLGN